ncbi:hypothetical protein TA05_01290 [Citrobacter rodentium]|nr:hypothetical protein TA05_01290 [Citrobacter rodentium]
MQPITARKTIKISLLFYYHEEQILIKHIQLWGELLWELLYGNVMLLSQNFYLNMERTLL